MEDFFNRIAKPLLFLLILTVFPSMGPRPVYHNHAVVLESACCKSMLYQHLDIYHNDTFRGGYRLKDFHWHWVMPHDYAEVSQCVSLDEEYIDRTENKANIPTIVLEVSESWALQCTLYSDDCSSGFKPAKENRRSLPAYGRVSLHKIYCVILC